MKFGLCLLVCISFAAFTEAAIPAGCKKVVDEVKSYANQIYDLLMKTCCDKSKCKPISMSMARPYVDDACVKIGDWVILNACKSKGINFPKDWNGQMIKSIATAIEELPSVMKHPNLCQIQPNDKIVGEIKSKIIAKALPKAMGLMPLIPQCPKGVGIAAEIMNDAWQGKGKMQGTPDIVKMMHAACDQWCGGSG